MGSNGWVRSYLLLLNHGVPHLFSFVAVWNSYFLKRTEQKIVYEINHISWNVKILITHDIFLSKIVLCQPCQAENVLRLKSKMEHKWLCFLMVSPMFIHNISVYPLSNTESHKHTYTSCIHKELLCLNPYAIYSVSVLVWCLAGRLLTVWCSRVSWSGPLRPVHFSSPLWEAKLESSFSRISVNQTAGWSVTGATSTH